MSATVLVTSITSFIGFLLNSTVLFLVLSRGRRKYHYLFAGFLFVCALWDIGVFLAMIRNSHVNELPIYGYVVFWPCTFIVPLIYHFTCAYLKQPRKKSTIFAWSVCSILFVLGVSGLVGKIEGVYNYSWGNIFRPDSQLLMDCIISVPLWYIFIWASCWFLFRAYRQETSPLKKRHILYILISFFIISLMLVKTIVLYGIDFGFVMPTAMLLNDIAAALIGIAIIKYQLFDITIIIKKTTIYSILLAIIVFVFSLSEHLLATYVGQIFGEHSFYIHLISVAAVVGVLMPVRQKVEGTIERLFTRRTVEF
ncbi:histidine kinase N-terminal 7TM domain-containing protein [Chloroflexota bacterium]